MNGRQVNRVSRAVVIALSAIALLAVLSGYIRPRQPDEGTAAHIFQLSIVTLVPTILLFLGTADWRQPRQIARQLTIPTSVLVLAFGTLYCLEHYR